VEFFPSLGDFYDAIEGKTNEALVDTFIEELIYENDLG